MKKNPYPLSIPHLPLYPNSKHPSLPLSTSPLPNLKVYKFISSQSIIKMVSYLLTNLLINNVKARDPVGSKNIYMSSTK